MLVICEIFDIRKILDFGTPALRKKISLKYFKLSKNHYKSNLFLSSAYIVSPGPTSRKFIYLSFFFHSVSNFLGASLDKALVSGSGSDIPLIQDIEPSNSRARLSHPTLRFFSLADQCHTQNFYLRSFKSDFDAVKSKFDLLIE